MYISIHIPKTAGTTVGYILDYGLNRRIFYDYPRHGMGKRQGEVMNSDDVKRDIRMINEHRDFIKYKFDVIHGHFHYKKYKDVFPDEKYLVCLRDPLKRTISHYFHILESGSEKNQYYSDISKALENVT